MPARTPDPDHPSVASIDSLGRRYDNGAPVAASITEAVARVQARISAVTKDGKSTEGGVYSFRRIDDLINALHPILADEGVIIVPARQDVLSFVQPVPGRKEQWSAITILVSYEVRSRDCAGALTVQGLGIGLDNGDKGPGKALSYAYKSAISQLFSIPTDDPAMDAEMTVVEDPPDLVSPALLRTLADRSKALKATPFADLLRTRMEADHLLPGGRLPARATVWEASKWQTILDDIEVMVASEPWDVAPEVAAAAEGGEG